MPDNHTQQRVYHYRSSAITNSEIEKPNANNLEFGEIAINYNAQEPSLFIKQNDSEIAQFVDKKYIEDNINSLSGLNDVNISSPMDEQSLVYDSVNNEYINKYALAGAIPYGRCDSSSTATNFTATVPGITELKDGTCMLLKNGVITSASGFKINVNGLGAKPVYNNLASATAETTLFNSAYTILFIYDETRVSGGCWIYYRGYYVSASNSIGYQLRTNSSTRVTANKGYRYRIWFSNPDNTKWVSPNESTSTNATASRTVTTQKINPFGRIVYNSTKTDYATVGTVLPATTLWDQYTLSLGYSFNKTGAALTLTVNAPVYVKCSPETDGSATIDSTTPYVQTLPSTDDGKIYIYLGVAYSATNIELEQNHPVFYHDGDGIRVWNGKKPFSGDYSDLTNKPTIPTVPTKVSEFENDANYITSAVTSLKNFATSANVVTALNTKANSSDIKNSTITIQKNSTTVDSFTLNQSSNKTIDITVPTKTSDLTNDSNYINSAVTSLKNFATSANVVTALDNKVDKIDGKGLSTNDYTNDEKNKLGGIEANAQKNGNAYKLIKVNATGTNLSATTSADTFTISAGTNITLTAGTKKVTISAKDTLPGTLTTTATTSLTTATNESLSGSVSLHKVSKTGSYNDLLNKPTIPTVPTKVSAFENDANYITSAVTNLTNFATSSNTVSALNNKVDKISGKGLSANDFDNAYKGKLDNIASGAEVNVQSDWNVSDSNSDAYIKNKPTIGNAALTIQKNGTNVGSFSANQTTNKTINIVVPTTASDVNALPDSTKYAASLSLDINSSTYVVTAQLKDQEGNNLGTQQTIDLPLETMVVSGSYISSAKTVSLVLQNGNKIEFSVADLVSGLQTEITDSNKLSADLIENGNTNKVFTSSEKTKLSNLASSLATTSASGYMSSTQVTKLNGIESGAEVNVQSDWNVSDANSDAYIKNKPTIPAVNNGALTITTGTSASLGSFSANQSTNTTVTLHKVAATGNYNDLTNTPTIGNGVFTINTGTTSLGVGSFSANQTTNKTITLHKVVATGKVGDLTNDANYINSAVTSLKNYATSANVVTALGNKVDKVTGKGLSTNDYTTTEKNKLASIASGAQVNVQSDWNETNSGSDAYILNKPSIQQVYTVEFEVRADSADQSIENAIVSSNTSYSEILNLINDGFEIKAHANVIADNEQIVYSIDMNRISSVGDTPVVFNGCILTLPYGSSEILIAWDNNNSKWLVGDSSPKLNVYYNDDQSPTVFSISLLNSDSIHVIDEFKYLNDIHITNATSGDILTYHTNEYGGDGYWTNITPNFITSAVTAMTNYATSANVVSELDKKVETFECEFTMTMDSTSQEEFPYNCTITCDKTVNEISSAAANGKKILAKCDISNMFAELSGVQYISYWEITNNIYNGENAYVGFDVDMIMVLVGEIHFSVFGYGEDNLWKLEVALNSNDLNKVHNLQPVATAGTIGYLNDVAIYNSASSGQILQYDGTNWVNVDNNNALSSLSDVLLSGVTSGQTLQYNGTKWVNVDNKNASSIINITYAELKQLRDSSGLTPNQEYRITDYETLVNPYRLGAGNLDYRSATQIVEGVSASTHLFDIIVRAMSESVLDVNARAEHHDGDTYFENSDLSKWSLKYTIDNDTFVHQWALDLYDISLTSDGETNNLTAFIISKKNDLYYYAGKVDGGDYIGFCSNDRVLTTQSQLYSVDLEPLQVTINSVTHRSGKGVIYNMIDEYNNNCPYDFKNILFKRTKCIFSATTKDFEHVDTLVGSNGEYQMFGNGSFEMSGSTYLYLRKDDDTKCDYCINRSGLVDIDSLNSATILAISSMTQYDSVVSYTRPLIDYLDNKTYGNIGMMFGIADESNFVHGTEFTFDETFSRYFYTFSILTNQVTIDDCSVQGKASHNIITESTTICGYILNLATSTMLPNNVFITEKTAMLDGPTMNVALISDNTLTKSINNTLIYTSGTDNPVNPYNSGINGITFNYSHYNIMVNPCISLSNSYSNLIFDCGYEFGACLGENWNVNLFVDSTAYVGGFLTNNLIVSCGEQVSLYGECSDNKIFGSTTSLYDSRGNYIINTSSLTLQGHNEYCRIGSKLIHPNSMHITLLPRVDSFAISMPYLKQNYIVYDGDIILNDTNNYNDEYIGMNTITVKRNSQGVVKYYNEADLIQ